MRHRAMVTTDSDGETVTITIVCDNCDGGVFTLATAHIETLARVLPKLCEAVGIDLAGGVTEAHVFDLGDQKNKAAAEAMYREFVNRRTHPERKPH